MGFSTNRRVSKIGHEIYPVFCSLVEFMMLDLHLRWFLGDEIDPIIVVLFQSQIVQGETHIRCTILQPSTVCWIEVKFVAPIGSPWLIENMYSIHLALNRSTHHCLKQIPLNPIAEKSYPLDLIIDILDPSHHWIP